MTSPQPTTHNLLGLLLINMNKRWEGNNVKGNGVEMKGLNAAMEGLNPDVVGSSCLLCTLYAAISQPRH